MRTGRTVELGESDLHRSGWVCDRVACEVKDSAVNRDWGSYIKGVHLVACVVKLGADCSVDPDYLSLR